MSAQVMQILCHLCQGPELLHISYGGRYLGSIPWWYWNPIALEWWVRVLRAESFMGGERLYWSQSPGEWVPGWVPLSVTLNHVLRWFVQELIRKGKCDKEGSVILAGLRRINSLVTPVGLVPGSLGSRNRAGICLSQLLTTVPSQELSSMSSGVWSSPGSMLLSSAAHLSILSSLPAFHHSFSLLYSHDCHQPCLFTSYPPTSPL